MKTFKTFYNTEKYPNVQYDSFNEVIKNSKNFELDKVGIIQFIKFFYPLYNRTFINEVKFNYSWDNGDKLFFKYGENRKGYLKANELLLWEILQNSLKEICINKEKIYGVGNSGGLDSRLLLFILKNLNVNLKSYTFGDPSSDAIYVASKTAKLLKIEHKNIKIESNFLRKFWSIMIEKKPMFSLLHSWSYSVLKQLPSFDLQLTGFNGDNMLGSHLSKELLEIHDKTHLYKYIYNHYSTVPDNLLTKVVNDKTLLKNSYKDYILNIQKSENQKNENIFEEFNFKCRQLRFIINSVNFDYCGALNWFSPFCTKEFLDFALSLTFKERYQRNLYLNTVRKNMKELNHLRFERTYLSTKDKNKLKILTKKFFWKYDIKFKTKLYYKGPHKNVKAWLIRDNALDFIKMNFAKPSSKFEEIFNRQYILNNIESILDANINLLFNLLTVKLWIENIYC